MGLIPGERLAPEFAPRPLSTATNAHDFLSDVAEAIEEEPRRVWMGDWYRTGESLWEYLRSRFGPRAHEQRPACGMAACVGGWIVLLHDGTEQTGDSYSIEGRARTILRGRNIWAGEVRELHCDDGGLFSPTVYAWEAENPNVVKDEPEDAWDEDEDGIPRAEQLQPGHPNYAKAVVNRIRRYQRKYAEVLQATPVHPVAQGGGKPRGVRTDQGSGEPGDSER